TTRSRWTSTPAGSGSPSPSGATVRTNTSHRWIGLTNPSSVKPSAGPQPRARPTEDDTVRMPTRHLHLTRHAGVKPLGAALGLLAAGLCVSAAHAADPPGDLNAFRSALASARTPGPAQSKYVFVNSPPESRGGFSFDRIDQSFLEYTQSNSEHPSDLEVWDVALLPPVSTLNQSL